MSARRALSALALPVAALVLSGCNASVATGFTLDGEATDVTITARFSGDAATVMSEDQAVADELIKTVQARTGVTPTTSYEAGTYEVLATVPYAKVGELAEITGVKGASSATPDGATRVRVDLTDAPALRSAIRTAVKDSPDGAALAQTMIEQTDLVTVVHFAGSLKSAEVTGKVAAKSLTTNDTTATVTRPLDAATEGSLDTLGDPTGGPGLLVLIGGGAAVGALALVWARSRRPRSASTSHGPGHGFMG